MHQAILQGRLRNIRWKRRQDVDQPLVFLSASVLLRVEHACLLQLQQRHPGHTRGDCVAYCCLLGRASTLVPSPSRPSASRSSGRSIDGRPHHCQL
jgi:hypothetical protein